jgi:hypothetical protein
LCIGLCLFGCSGKDNEAVSTDKWNGTYMWLDEETDEFKLLEAVGVDEQTVAFVLESSRTAEEFEAHTKSNSGRYLVENLGSKTVKVTLSADFETVVVDDMWTDNNAKRKENWTGKYHRITEDMEIPSFGDKSWNGTYLLEDTNLTVSVYGIREGYALFSYMGEDAGEEVEYNLRLLEPERGKAVYTEGERLIILELLTKGRLKVTDLYMNDSSNKGISGIYKKQ